MSDQRIQKWTGWIDGTIKHNVLMMHLHRDTWTETAAILEANDDLPDSYWWEFMRDTYATTQAVAVRRQADAHKDAASLRNLIEEVLGDAGRITKDFWVNLWDDPDPWDSQMAAQQWKEHYGGEVASHLDPAIPAQDLDSLIQAAANVKSYVDQHVAHSDASAVSADVTLTLSEVHEAIDVVGTLFQRYYSLFTASSMAFLTPTIHHDWRAAFRQPWLSAGQP